jgi:hypothetical protein
MAKTLPTIVLNDLQIATLNALQANATDRLVRTEHAQGFKQNVINALVHWGALIPTKPTLSNKGYGYRIANADITRRPDHTPRAPKVVPATETDSMSVAA